MTRPNLLVGALAAVCAGTLLWCAWLILAADLPRGARVASWGLWALAAVAVLTLVAYVGEFLRHRQAIGRGASWKPLPSLVLLWVAGLTALASFTFMLPDRPASAGPAQSGKTSISLTGATVTSTPDAATSSAGATRDSGRTADAASRSVSSRPAVPSSSSSPESTGSTAAEPGPSARATAPSTPSTPSSSGTTPLIDLDILPTWPRPTTPFGP